MNILNLPDWNVLKVEETEHDYVVTAEPKKQVTACHHCLSKDLRRFGKKKPFFLHLPAHGKRVGIRAEIQRYKCASCGKILQQPATDIDETRNATVPLLRFIEKQSMEKTFVEVAADVGMDERSVRRIFDGYAKKLEAENQFMTPKFLGIDEITIRRTPRLILTNIGEATIYDIYPSRKLERVVKYLSAIPDKQTIRLVAMDMWKPYKMAVEAVLPGAKIVIDKFHVVKLANKAVDDYRKSLSGELTTSDKRQLMRSRYILLKRKKDLNEQDKFTLETWTSTFALLGFAHELKEAFYGIYDARDRHDAERRYWDWQLSIPKELEGVFGELIKAVKNWKEEIFAYFDYRITNAFTESMNSKIRKIESEGRGYSFEVLRTKALFTSGFKKRERPKMNRRPNLNADTLAMINPFGNQEDVVNYGVPISTFVERLERGDF